MTKKSVFLPRVRRSAAERTEGRADKRTEERCSGIPPDENAITKEIRVQTGMDEKPKGDWREVCKALTVCAAYLLFTTFAFPASTPTVPSWQTAMSLL